MRVLHLAPRPDAGSGIATYASRFRAALRSAGVEVVPLAAPAEVMHSVADIRAYCRAAVRESARGAHLVHAELGGGSLRDFYAARAIIRAGRLPLVATIHDPPRPVWWPYHTHAIREWRLLGSGVRRATGAPAARLEHSTLAQCAGLFALTHAGVDSVGRQYGAEIAAKTAYLPFSIGAECLEEDEREPNPVLTVGFFGYWYLGKGLDALVEALLQLQRRGVPFSARLWGDISPTAGSRIGLQYREQVLAHVDRAGLSPHVEALGFLDPDAVTASLQRCDVVVLPYEYGASTSSLRSTSAAMHEALAAGTPVIASDVRALDEVLIDGDNGFLVPPGDVAVLASRLEAIAREPGLRERLRDGARRTARTFDPAAAAAAAVAVYEAALAGR